MNRVSSFALFFIALTLALLPETPLTAQAPPAYHHSFHGVEHWAHFDDPKRDEWQKPDEVIQALALKPDAITADIGSGTGYFSVRLAHMTPKGRVYGVDTEPDMVKYLSERAKREGLTNVISVQAAPDDPRLPERVDLILMVDVIHMIDNRQGYFRRLHDSLKPGGRIAIIDYRMDSPGGPPKSARLTPDELKAEMKQAGYALAQEHAFLPRQHFMIFE